jgi:hypothetical protein
VQYFGRGHEFRQRTRRPRAQLPVADPARQEGAERHAVRQVLKIVATDPGSVKDFQAFSKQTGNNLLSQSESDKEFVFFLKRK